MSRQQDLEQHVNTSYELIREYEEILQLSSDPREKARCRREMAEQWALIRDWLVEYYRLVGGAFSPDLRQIAARFELRPAESAASPRPSLAVEASGERSVAIGGEARDTIVITGDVTIELPGGNVEELRRVLEALKG